MQLNINKAVVVLGIVARMNEPKNHNFLIDIFQEYIKLNKNSKLLLIGDGYLREKIEEKIEKLALSDKVLLLGDRTDVNKLYSAIDIYVMPSLYEGLSISLCEAQVNGLRCYTSTRVDTNSNITNNVEFLSLKKSAKEWAEHIFKNDNTRDKDVINKIPDEFNDKKSYNKLFEYYIECLK